MFPLNPQIFLLFLGTASEHPEKFFGNYISPSTHHSARFCRGALKGTRRNEQRCPEETLVKVKVFSFAQSASLQ
jgi:hypothetical protein